MQANCVLDEGVADEVRLLRLLAIDLHLAESIAHTMSLMRDWDMSSDSHALLTLLRTAAGSSVVRATVSTIILNILRSSGPATDDARALRAYVRYGPQPNGGIIHAPPKMSFHEARTCAPPDQVAILLLWWLALLPKDVSDIVMPGIAWLSFAGKPAIPTECMSRILHTATPTITALLRQGTRCLRFLQPHSPEDLFENDTDYLATLGYTEMAVYPFEDTLAAFNVIRDKSQYGVPIPALHMRKGWVALPLALSTKRSAYEDANVFEAELCRVFLTAGSVIEQNCRATVARLRNVSAVEVRAWGITSQFPETSWVQVMLGRLPVVGMTATKPRPSIQTRTLVMRPNSAAGAPSKGWRVGAMRPTCLAFIASIAQLHLQDPTNGTDSRLYDLVRVEFARALPPCMYSVIEDAGFANDHHKTPERRFKLKRKFFLMRTLRALDMTEPDATWLLEVLLHRSKPREGRDAGDKFENVWRQDKNPSLAQGCLSLRGDPLYACPWVDPENGLQTLRQYTTAGNHPISDLEDLFANARSDEGRRCGNMCTRLQLQCVMSDEPPDTSFMAPMRWTHRQLTV